MCRCIKIPLKFSKISKKVQNYKLPRTRRKGLSKARLAVVQFENAVVKHLNGVAWILTFKIIYRRNACFWADVMLSN